MHDIHAQSRAQGVVRQWLTSLMLLGVLGVAGSAHARQAIKALPAEYRRHVNPMDGITYAVDKFHKAPQHFIKVRTLCIWECCGQGVIACSVKSVSGPSLRSETADCRVVAGSPFDRPHGPTHGIAHQWCEIGLWALGHHSAADAL